jgi:hypothetical protein
VPAGPELALDGQVGKVVSPVLTDLGEERPFARSPEQVPDQGDGEDRGIRADRRRPRSARDRHDAREQGIVDQDKDVDKQVGQWHHRKGPPWQEVVGYSFSARGAPLLSNQPTSRA